ncbi:hypothetical protein Tco_0516334 [Tanacetum coccineum]
MKESEAFKTYYAFATGKAIPKLKYVHQTTKEKTVQSPKSYLERKESNMLLREGQNRRGQQHNTPCQRFSADEGTGLNQGSQNVLVIAIAEPPLLSVTTTPPPPTPLITHLQQRPVPTPATVPSSSLKDLPIWLLFTFDIELKTLKILLRVTINEQLEAEILTRSSNESKTSYAVATNLSELELKKILIDKIESNKHRDDGDKDEEPFTGSNRGFKRRRSGKEPESTSAPKENTSKTTGKSTEGSKSHHKFAGKFAQAEEPMHTAKDLEELAH